MKSHINSIGTANPPFKISQQESLDFISQCLDLNIEEKNKMAALYRATGIDFRYSVLEDFKNNPEGDSFFRNSDSFPTVSQRMAVYKETALPICIKAIEDCLAKLPNISPSSITHLITVSCTGMYAPGLDIELIDHLKVKTNIQRTAVNFMGCYGAFNAIKVADVICRADQSAKVLIVSVELCTLHLLDSKEDDHILSGSLFGDGAAAVLISGIPLTTQTLTLESFYCDLLREGKDDMAWHISDFGFQMKLSSYVPELIRGGIKKLTDNLLEHLRLNISNIDFFAIHPGGKRILQVIEQELGLPKEDNFHAYNVLKNFGNMSSPTVLFVLKSIIESLSDKDEHKNILSFAFGPGLTLESMLLKVNNS